jgi:hypothetical protein
MAPATRPKTLFAIIVIRLFIVVPALNAAGSLPCQLPKNYG